jgi:hypothetical protein
MIDPHELLKSLRWDVDDLVTNSFSERVWLKACIVNGVRIGITDCCFEDEPCDHHKQVALGRTLAEGGKPGCA